MTYGRAMAGANPDYGKPGYDQNCQRCVDVYEMRRRGYDVEALPRTQSLFGNKRDTVKTGLECYENPQKVGWPFEPKSPLTKDDMMNQLSAMPDGARFNITTSWGIKSSGGQTVENGHTFICEKIDGQLRFIDPQSGSIEVSRYLAQGQKFGYCRVDNLSFKKNYDWTDIAKAKTQKNTILRNKGETKMFTESESINLLKAELLKDFTSSDFEKYDIHIEPIPEEKGEDFRNFLVSVEPKGKEPSYFTWQVDIDGGIGPLIVN